jgi:DNA polymerase-3 subunit epsilon
MINRIWQQGYRWWQQKQLKDPAYQFLFEPPQRAGVVSFDCETTGLDAKKDDIITLSAIRVIGDQMLTSEALHLTLRPSQAIAASAIQVHGLRNCDVQEGLSPQEAMTQFLQFIGSSPLLGYYLEFDIALVNRILKPWLGIHLPNERIELSARYYDYRIGRIPQHNIDLRFDAIRQHLNLPDLGAHDAFSDALMVAMAYLALEARRGNRGKSTASATNGF